MDKKLTHKGRKKLNYCYRLNCIVDCQFKTAILKADITDHFPLAMALRTDELVHQSQKLQNIHKCNYDGKAIELFKQQI